MILCENTTLKVCAAYIEMKFIEEKIIDRETENPEKLKAENIRFSTIFEAPKDIDVNEVPGILLNFKNYDFQRIELDWEWTAKQLWDQFGGFICYYLI